MNTTCTYKQTGTPRIPLYIDLITKVTFVTVIYMFDVVDVFIVNKKHLMTRNLQTE